jgi:uncharacterized protein
MLKESKYNIFLSLDEKETILYNSFTGSMSKVDNSNVAIVKRILKKPNESYSESSRESEFYQTLIEGKYLIDSSFDEIASLKVLSRLLRYNDKSLSLVIVPTLECNLACSYCFEKSKMKSRMSESDIDNIVSFVGKKIVGLKSLTVVWFGGEPLLQPEIISNITRQLKTICDLHKVQYASTITTNGVLLDTANIRNLAEWNVKLLIVTIDGPREVHDKRRYLHGGGKTFDTILSNLNKVKQFHENSISVFLRINIDESNIDTIDSLVECFIQQNLKGKVVLCPAVVSNDSIPCLNNKKFSLWENRFVQHAAKNGFQFIWGKQADATSCGACCYGQYVIAPGCKVYRCVETVTEAGESVGSIIGGEFHPNDVALKWLAYDAFEDDVCKECKLLPICYGGCPLAALRGVERLKRCTPEKRNLRDIIRTSFELNEFLVEDPEKRQSLMIFREVKRTADSR